MLILQQFLALSIINLDKEVAVYTQKYIETHALDIISQLANPLYLFLGENIVFVNNALISMFNEITGNSLSGDEIILSIKTSELRKVFGHGEKEEQELEKKLQKKGFLTMEDAVFGRYLQNGLIFKHIYTQKKTDNTPTIAMFIYSNVPVIYEELLMVIVGLVGKKHGETKSHLVRMVSLTDAMCKALQMDAHETQLIKIAAKLHDIGKLCTPDNILMKPGSLTPKERKIMQLHTIIGSNMLFKVNRLNTVAQIIRSHHENFDGSGYPDGISEEKIHLGAQIVSISDVFDAITNKRCYKEAQEKKKALDYINSQRNKKFKPELVDVFLYTQSA